MNRQEEKGHHIGFLAATGVILSFLGNFFIVLSYSLFLKNIGVIYIPYYYIIFNAISIGLGALFLIKNVSSTKGLITSNLFMTIIYACTGLFCDINAPAVIFVIYILSTLFYIYSLIFFWNYINSSFSITYLKKCAGIFSASIFAGAISSGFLIKPLLLLFSEKYCFLFASCICIILSILVRQYTCRRKQEYERIRRQGEPLFPRELFDIEIIRLMVLFTLLFVSIRYLVDYEFSRIVARNFPDARSLSGFMGSFTATIYMCIFIWQTCFLHRALRTFSIASMFTFMAIIFLFIATACIFCANLITIVIFQASILLLIKAIRQPSQNVLIKAVAPDIRSSANFLLCGIAEALSVMAAGLLIAVLNICAAPHTIFYLLIFSGSLTALLLTSLLKRSYLDLLIRNLKSEKPGLIYPINSDSEFQPASLLGSDNRENRKGIVQLLQTEKDPAVLAALIKTVATLKTDRAYLEEIAGILRHSDNPAIITQCIETLAIMKGSEYSSEILPWLSSKNLWVKTSAILFIIRLSKELEHNRKAVMELYSMTVSDDAHLRSAAASIQGQLGLECFERSLITLLQDRDARVRKRAVMAALNLRSLSLLPVLRELRESEENHTLAQLISNVIIKMNDVLYNGIMSMTACLSHHDRQKVRSSLLRIANEKALEPMFRALRVLTPPLSTAMVELIAGNEKDESLLRLVSRCFKGDSFSFSPLIWSQISREEDSGVTRPLFLNITGSNGEELFCQEYGEISKTLEENEHDRKVARKLLHLGVDAFMEERDAALVYEHMITPSQKEDLSSEILESTISDRILKEAFERLIHLARSA